MKTLMIILFSILSIENSAAELKDWKSFDALPPYVVTITGNSATDCVTITLTPGRYLVGGEKIKIFITDKCGNPVYYGQFMPGPDFSISSTVTVCKSEFDLGNFCWVYNNGDMDFIVEAYYDLNDGNPQGIGSVRI